MNLGASIGASSTLTAVPRTSLGVDAPSAAANITANIQPAPSTHPPSPAPATFHLNSSAAKADDLAPRAPYLGLPMSETLAEADPIDTPRPLTADGPAIRLDLVHAPAFSFRAH